MHAYAKDAARFLAALVLLAVSVPSVTAPPAAPSDIWVALHKTLLRVDPASNVPSGTVALSDEADALAVDPRDGAVWALSHKRLSKFDRTGQSLLDIRLKDIEPKFDEADSIALNPYEGAVWIAGKKQLLYLDVSGAKRIAWSAPDKIEAIALDLDETLWVATKRELLHIAEDGRILSTLDLKPHAKDVKNLVVDGLGGLLWIVEEKVLLRFDISRLNQSPLRIPLPTNHDDVETAASHPVFGTLWLAGKDALLLYDRSGTFIKQVDLKPHGLGEIEAMAYEPVSASLWLAGKKSVARFTGNGDYVTRIDMQKEIEAIAAGLFTLAPSLTLIAPPDNSLTNNPTPRLEYELGAHCDGSPCLLVDSYINSLNLDIDLNGQSVGPLFSRNGARAFYDPTTRLPEGANTVKATATDVFGHASPTVTSRFTIDTVPPKFVSLSPADGSTFTQAAVTIAGAVDDPTANVILADANGQGISMGGANFNFSVILTNGLNSFLLTARDPAGNAASLSLRLAYANQVQVTNLTDGAIVNGTSTWVIGTYDGALNTGITVNGVVAQTYGNTFYAQVALTPGVNELTVIATGTTGEIGRQTVTVRAEGSGSVTVEQIPHPYSRITTVAGNGEADYNGDGIPATQAALTPSDIAIAQDGSLYVVDTANHRIRRIGADGLIHTVAGTGSSGFSGDGELATFARLNYPSGIAVAPDGSLYIADAENNRVRRVSLEGVITTVAGGAIADETSNSIGDGGMATEAILNYPSYVTVAPDGAFYIADSYQHRIRKVTPDGLITTVAGNGEAGYNGDDIPATQASLSYPRKVTLGADGGFYIADSGNYRIRKVSADGVITTVAGTGVYGYNGDGIPAVAAHITDVYAIVLSDDGTIYFGDANNQRVRKVSPDGTITTIAGTGTGSDGIDGDGPPAVTAVDYPIGVALSSEHILYVIDSMRVRAFTPFNTGGDFAPQLVAFKVSYQGGAAIQRIEVDYDGDGRTDFTTTDPTQLLQHHYLQAGAYNAIFSITDTQGRTYRLTTPVVIKSTADIDRLLRGVYTGMLDRLRAGDTEGALSAVSGGLREKYRAIFAALRSGLPTIVNQLGTLQSGAIGGEMAEYALVRSQNGTSRAFLIYFLRGEDGVWRIDGM